MHRYREKPPKERLVVFPYLEHVSRTSLSGRAGVLELGSGGSRAACPQKSDSTRKSSDLCSKAAKKDAPGPSPTPDGSIPSFSAVHSHKRRNNSDSNQTPKSLLPTLFSCYVQRNWRIAKCRIGCIGAPADSPSNQKDVVSIVFSL